METRLLWGGGGGGGGGDYMVNDGPQPPPLGLYIMCMFYGGSMLQCSVITRGF